MSLENLEIIDGEAVKENLKSDELEKLVTVWLGESSPNVDTTALETHEQVAETLKKKEKSESLTKHLKEVIDAGDMVIARVDGKIAGMVRVYDTGRAVTVQNVQHPFFEVGKALVMPEFRKQGIYKKLRAQSIANLRKKHGDVLILSGTKQDHVKKLNRDDGWMEIGFDDYMRIYGASEEEIQAEHEARIKKGWTAFLYVPDSLKQKTE
jgi:predicted GNAT family N-acyltransferase